MKLQNLIVIFIIIVLPIVLILSYYISNGLKTIEYQSLYDNGLVNASHDALYAFELNTANDELSENPEVKKDILKASIKMFEKSLCNTCNIPSYNTDEIEEYIPAIVFGMYDGFYMYAPSYNSITGKYEHSLKNYVYYSETLQNDKDDVIITYSLDNYITVCGDFGSGYEVKKGYLQYIDETNTEEHYGKEYAGVEIATERIDGETNTEAQQYYSQAFVFTHWFLNDAGMKNIADYLNISSTNDPEDENSAFVRHKREVIKEKIEGVLNSTITAYSERTWGQNYKMPKLSEEDWQKVYSNISMISFFQGKNIGFTKYNGYTVVNSTNSEEYVNPSLMYFIGGEGDGEGEYHDIRCDKCGSVSTLTGYRIGSFEKRKVEETDDSGNTTTTYEYNHDELACYNCVNGSLSTSQSIYDYVKPYKGLGNNGSANDSIKSAYWTSLGRERYNGANKVTPIDLKIDVTFDANGGQGSNVAECNATYDYGDTIIFPNRDEYVLTKEGHTFKGWSTSKDEKEPDNITGEVKAYIDVTYYAVWEPVKYEITYNWNYTDENGNYVKTTAEKEYGSNPFDYNYLLDKKERIGYDLVGWEKEKSGTRVAVDTDNERVTGETIYYAQWQIKTYDITFDYNGGTYAEQSATTKTVSYGTIINNIIPEAEKPTKVNYRFIGWNKDANSTSVVGNDETATKKEKYYAIWEPLYNITFDYNGGTYAEQSTTTKIVSEGTIINNIIPENERPTRANYEFVGWGIAADSTEKITNEVKAIEDKTYYAIWKVYTYNIEFYYYDGEREEKIGEEIVKHGDNIPFPDDPTREGYTFMGWNTNQEAKSGTRQATAEGTANGQVIKYYTTWEINKYTITYKVDGSQYGEIETHYYGNSITIRTAPTREGYIFSGWNPSTLPATMPDYDIGVRGTFTANTYTVKYNGNGNTGGSTADSIHTYDVAQNLTANGFTKTGYTFAGWATSASGSVVYSNGQSVTNLTQTPNGTVNLFAVWTANTYTVKYNGNGNTGGSTADSTHTYDVAQNLTANGFTKTGYTFEGWATSASGSVVYSNGQSVTNLIQTPNGTVNLFAVWKNETYTITYIRNYNTSDNTNLNTLTPKTATYNETVTLPTNNNNLTRSGYTFVGWSTTRDGIAMLSLRVTGNTTLYAKWKLNEPDFSKDDMKIDITLTNKDNGSSGARRKDGNSTSYSWVSFDLDIKIVDGLEHATEYEFVLVDSGNNDLDTTNGWPNYWNVGEFEREMGTRNISGNVGGTMKFAAEGGYQETANGASCHQYRIKVTAKNNAGSDIGYFDFWVVAEWHWWRKEAGIFDWNRGWNAGNIGITDEGLGNGTITITER